MKQNAKNRYNGRYNNNRASTNRSPLLQNITRHTSLESTGPAGKLHGTALQLFDKYTQAAKDALIQNDRVLSETYLQYADHYARLQNIAIENEMNNRPQKRPTPAEQTAPESQTPSETDVLPDFNLPTDTDTADTPSETDQALQSMDLSVPIQVMQQNHRAPQRRSNVRKNEKKTTETEQPAPTE